MSVITKELAEKYLKAWLDAELAVTTGQSYSIGSRQLTRASMSEIRRQIAYWRNELAKIEMKEKGTRINSSRRIQGIIPRDF